MFVRTRARTRTSAPSLSSSRSLLSVSSTRRLPSGPRRAFPSSRSRSLRTFLANLSASSSCPALPLRQDLRLKEKCILELLTSPQAEPETLPSTETSNRWRQFRPSLATSRRCRSRLATRRSKPRRSSLVRALSTLGTALSYLHRKSTTLSSRESFFRPTALSDTTEDFSPSAIRAATLRTAYRATSTVTANCFRPMLPLFKLSLVSARTSKTRVSV
mmetsp:Transcript_30530/g.95824  ORF Transcript_30530/g.95824 Transcript_30530/m.95824 type:complete len:217 (-) Transcript_30530:935-1585(-)